MSIDQQQILSIIRRAVAELDEPDRAQVEECAAKLRELLAGYGVWGGFALGLVGAENAAAAEADETVGAYGDAPCAK